VGGPEAVVMNGTEVSITVVDMASAEETAHELGMEYMLVGDDCISLPSPESNFSEDLEVF
jgi:hypothetical protein